MAHSPASPAFWQDIAPLKPTQLYLSRQKVDRVNSWFHPSLQNFTPVSVRDFLGGGTLYLTDGHSRAYVAWRSGCRLVPCVYENSQIVTSPLGQAQYRNDIQWCERFHIRHISHLAERIVPPADYAALWQERCERMYQMELALQNGALPLSVFQATKQTLLAQGFFLYGFSQDLTVCYYENAAGELLESPFPLP